MNLNLTGKRALVLAASRGLGYATALGLAREGASLVICSRDRARIDEAAARIRTETGVTVEAVVADVSSADEAASLVQHAVTALGGLDIVVHNAGGCPWTPLEQLSAQVLEDTLSLNLKCCFWLTQAALPQLRARGGGRILITSSVTGPRTAMAGAVHYAAAKAGVNGFIRCAALELAREHITVNGVEPGFIAKDRGRMSQPEARARIERYIPLGTMGAPEDIAHAMLYLASSAGRWVTGQTLVVDGGATLPETGYAMELLPP